MALATRRLPGLRFGAAAVVGALLVAAVFGRPLVHGSAAADVVRVWLFVALYVVSPGVLAWRALRPRARDLASDLALGTVLGIVLVSLAFVATRALHVESAFCFWPVVALPLAWLARRNGSSASNVASRSSASGPNEPRDANPASWSTAALLAVAVLAIVRAPLANHGAWWCELDFDLSFHTGNAAALWRGLPFEDSRVAGLYANYHFLSYALAAGARDVFGVSVEESLGRSLQVLVPALLTFTVAAAARAWTGAPRAGVVAAALVVLHGDLGVNAAKWLGERLTLVSARSYMEYGIFTSPSMELGLVYTSAIAALLAPYLTLREGEPARERVRLGVVIALFALAASGTKGSVMPVLACGAFVLFARELALRGLWRSALGVCAALALPALPVSMLLALGSGSHASAMFRRDAWQAWETSPLFVTCAKALGLDPEHVPRALTFATGPAWIFVYLGAAGVLGAAWFWTRRRALDAYSVWVAGVLGTGLVLACSLRALGFSELFFLYPGQVLLATAGGAYVASLARPARSPLVWLAAVFLVCGGITDVAANVRRDAGPKPVETHVLAEFRTALEWARDHTPRASVIFAAHHEPFVSALTERTSFYESERATAAYLNGLWTLQDGRWRMPARGTLLYPERVELLLALRTTPSLDVVARARATVPGRPFFVIVDRRRAGPGGRGGPRCVFDPVGEPRIPDAPELTLVFENGAARVYAVR